VRDVNVKPDMSVHELLEQFRGMGGFSSTQLTLGIDILLQMFRDPKCTRFLSFTANLAATGLRGALAGLINRGIVDVIVTTGGAVDHDIARSFGGKYYGGTFEADDSFLYSKRIHRLGNVFIPMRSYGVAIEDATQKALTEIAGRSKTWAPHSILSEIGARIQDPNSILAAAARKKVPVIVPGVTDSAFGTDLFLYAETHPFEINPLLDMKLISDIVFESQKTGAIILGGGISKHHTLWWNQFKEGLAYAVSITTAQEYDGSLSGARLHEAITWGKIKPDARNVTIDGDATVLFPLMLAEIYTRLKTRKAGVHTNLR
jgi:deoxyhypusine synthase